MLRSVSASVIIKLTLTFVTSLVPCVTATSCVSDVQYYSRLQSEADKVFTDHVLSVSTSRNLAQCAQACLRHSGNMFTFAKTAVTSHDNCRCHSKVMTSANPSVTSSVGARMYVPSITSDWLESVCATDSDCPCFATCVHNVCVCPYDTYYSDSLRLCITHCPDNLLGTRLLPYYHYGLGGYNGATYSGITFQACLQNCISPSTVCRSVEWGYGSGSCWLQTTDFAESPSTVIANDVGWIYHQRSCS